MSAGRAAAVTAARGTAGVGAIAANRSADPIADEDAAGPVVRNAVIGLIVNPVAGVGGAAGLGGSDGAEVQRAARSRGGASHAADRAAAVLRVLGSALGNGNRYDAPRILAAPGSMGESVCAAVGVEFEVLPVPISALTSGADTTACAAALAAAGVDLLLFAGGDGTATDVARGCGERVPILGIPSGVKMYSGCFAVGVRAAADLAAQVAARVADGRSVHTHSAEIVDVDEDLLRSGQVAPRLTAAALVPIAPAVQSRKAPTVVGPAGQVAALAAAAAQLLADGIPTALGPGGTMRAVAERLGLPKTLLGVDIVQVRLGERAAAPDISRSDGSRPDGQGLDGERSEGTLPNDETSVAAALLAAGASETELIRHATGGALRIVVSVIGGQGFLFGRGNQQLSARVLAAAGPGNIVILAPEAKLAALGGRPLLVDTGDADVDAALSGYRRVLTGPGEWAMYPVRGAGG